MSKSNQKTLLRLQVIPSVIERSMRLSAAAAKLGLSVRQVQRLVSSYKSKGPDGLVSGHVGRPGTRNLPDGIKKQTAELIRKHYTDFGPTFACEKLAERHGIIMSKETVRQIMISEGLWKPHKMRQPKIRQLRERRACYGELIQLDGSEHDWFEGRGPKCTVLVYVDDATSSIMHLEFVMSESTFSYFVATRKYIEKHGKPLALYSDRASVFRVNRKNARSGKGYTQFGRAMYELNIDSICAETCQATGRVERTNQTLQDRLVKELRLRGISTMEEANAYVEEEFIDSYNNKFAKEARQPFNAHRPVRDDETLDLIFACREQRCVSRTLSIQYNRKLYMFDDNENTRSLIGYYIDVYHYPDGRIEPRDHSGAPLPYLIHERSPVANLGRVVESKQLGHALDVTQALQERREQHPCRQVVLQPEAPRKRKRASGTDSRHTLSQEVFHDELLQVQDATGKLVSRDWEPVLDKKAPPLARTAGLFAEVTEAMASFGEVIPVIKYRRR